MNTYFVKGTYKGDYGRVIDFDIVFDLRPVNAENFMRQLRLKLGVEKHRKISIENIVKL